MGGLDRLVRYLFNLGRQQYPFHFCMNHIEALREVFTVFYADKMPWEASAILENCVAAR